MSVQSYNTAISRSGASAPLKFLEKGGYLKGSILDYGCGKGADYKHLIEAKYSADAYDPHWRPVDLGQTRFDTILCTYVLNVVDKDTEDEIIESVKNLLNESGQAFFSVRRDIKKEGKTSRGFQRNVILDLEVIKNTSSFCIYKLIK